jgi:hypothetical protein
LIAVRRSNLRHELAFAPLARAIHHTKRKVAARLDLRIGMSSRHAGRRHADVASVDFARAGVPTLAETAI